MAGEGTVLHGGESMAAGAACLWQEREAAACYDHKPGSRELRLEVELAKSQPCVPATHPLPELGPTAT